MCLKDIPQPHCVSFFSGWDTWQIIHVDRATENLANIKGHILNGSRGTLENSSIGMCLFSKLHLWFFIVLERVRGDGACGSLRFQSLGSSLGLLQWGLQILQFFQQQIQTNQDKLESLV